MSQGFSTGHDFGPAWFDVFSALRRMRSEGDDKLELCIETGSNIRGDWGLYITVRRRGTRTILGACGYGRAYPAGAKNVPTACFRALLQAEDTLNTYRDYVSNVDPEGSD